MGCEWSEDWREVLRGGHIGSVRQRGGDGTQLVVSPVNARCSGGCQLGDCAGHVLDGSCVALAELLDVVTNFSRFAAKVCIMVWVSGGADVGAEIVPR